MRKEPYRYVEHTADVEYIAFGGDMEKCFANALMAMFDTMTYKSKVSSSKAGGISFLVKDKAKSKEDLLWYLLQDTLSISDSKGIFPFKVQKLKIMEDKGNYKIEAKILAKPKEPVASKLDVKGVSRYNLSVRKARDGIEAVVVLDV